MSALLSKIRFAFDGNDVTRKNVALRAAYDEIERLQLMLDRTKFGLPEGYRLVKNEPGEMVHIDELVGWLTKVRDRFGNSCVYARDVCWGAVALNRQDDDKKAAAEAAVPAA